MSLLLADATRIPRVGLGTWRAEPGLVQAAVEAALHAGYRHIDCATVYSNQTEVGRGLAAFLAAPGAVARDAVYLVSKVPPPTPLVVCLVGSGRVYQCFAGSVVPDTILNINSVCVCVCVGGG